MYNDDVSSLEEGGARAGGRNATVSPVSHGAAPARDQAGNSSSCEDDGVHEKGAPVALKKRQKFKRHCLRFKWWYLLAVVIFLAIILPILFKVIIPALIKSIVGNQELPIKAGSLNALSPTQMEMQLDTMLDTPLGVKTDPLLLKLQKPGGSKDEDAPFVTLKLPEHEIDGETKVVFPDQTVDIIDEKQLTAWFNDFFDSEETELRVTAREMKTHLGALTYTVDLDKTIRVKGLTYLKGFGITDMEFMRPEKEGDDNIKGYLNVPNSGSLTLGLGTLGFYLMAGEVELGLVSLPDLVLKPGNNSATFHGQFYFDRLIPNLSSILESQDAISQGYVSLNATGSDVISADGQRIPYLEGVLTTKSIPLRIPVMDLMVDVMGGLMDNGGGAEGLIDRIGGVLGNDTLFSGLLDRFEGRSKGD